MRRMRTGRNACTCMYTLWAHAQWDGPRLSLTLSSSWTLYKISSPTGFIFDSLKWRRRRSFGHWLSLFFFNAGNCSAGPRNYWRFILWTLVSGQQSPTQTATRGVSLLGQYWARLTVHNSLSLLFFNCLFCFFSPKYLILKWTNH